MGQRALLAALLASSATACAPALPSFAGSRTTPADRVDVVAGMAARVPTGDLASGDSLALAGPAGIAPAGALRVGVSPELDMGLVVSSASGRAELRYGTRVGQLRAHVGLAGFGGYAVTDPDANGAQGSGWRAGAFVPLTLAFDVAGILEAWVGARFAFERVEGQLGPMAMGLASDAWGVRGGGVLGAALGFRRVHVLAELAIDGEWWSGHAGSVAFERAGVSLTPAFALRVRF
ncbi:MAG: hypothetical protein K1X94_00480 [Sandaracinaceae bacterium]|nr:hypothetical protein [Sandaracinaceae bacterium]